MRRAKLPLNSDAVKTANAAVGNRLDVFVASLFSAFNIRSAVRRIAGMAVYHQSVLVPIIASFHVTDKMRKDHEHSRRFSPPDYVPVVVRPNPGESTPLGTSTSEWATFRFSLPPGAAEEAKKRHKNGVLVAAKDVSMAEFQRLALSAPSVPSSSSSSVGGTESNPQAEIDHAQLVASLFQTPHYEHSFVCPIPRRFSIASQ